MRQNRKGKVIGLTGGVGCGKSTALSILQRDFGAKLIMADDLGHMVMETGHPAYEEICRHFGGGVLAEDGTLDRGALAQAVYSDRERLAVLNGIIHPYVLEEIKKKLDLWRAEPFVVIETAIMFETGCDKLCDEVWAVLADREVRIGRLMQSRGYTRQRAEAIMARQMDDGQFRVRCSRIIENNGDREQLKNRLKKLMDLYILC